MSNVCHTAPFFFVHIPHGAGTYICHQAILNSEHTCGEACLCDGGDTAYFPWKSTSCTHRIENALSKNMTFVSIERGLLEGEFCPEHMFFYFRHPVDRLESLISSSVKNVTEFFVALSKNQNVYPFRHGLLARVGLRFFDNFAVRSLVAQKDIYTLPFGHINESHYHVAVSNMMKLRFVMTDQFLFQHSAKAMQRFQNPPLCWTRFNTSSFVSINHHKVLSRKLSQKERKLLANVWNVWDMKLYETAWTNDIGHLVR